jgi:hypothetical protein
MFVFMHGQSRGVAAQLPSPHVTGALGEQTATALQLLAQ